MTRLPIAAGVLAIALLALLLATAFLSGCAVAATRLIPAATLSDTLDAMIAKHSPDAAAAEKAASQVAKMRSAGGAYQSTEFVEDSERVPWTDDLTAAFPIEAFEAEFGVRHPFVVVQSGSASATIEELTTLNATMGETFEQFGVETPRWLQEARAADGLSKDERRVILNMDCLMFVKLLNALS